MPSAALGQPGCFPHRMLQTNMAPVLAHGSSRRGESPPASLPRAAPAVQKRAPTPP